MDQLYFFLFYSFFGFLLEVFYAYFTHSKNRARKCFFFLPLCPVYGLGALAIVSLPSWILGRPVLLFVVGGITATAVEYLTALFYEVIVGVRFWDYSDLPANLSGRVCPLFSIFWGLLALPLVYGLHPFVQTTLHLLPPHLLPICLLILSMDNLLSLFLLHKSGSPAVLHWQSRVLQKVHPHPSAEA